MISVCMATYNGAQFIREQLNSILIQLGPDDEIIVSDDSSTDGTLDIVNSYGDSRIKVFAGNKFHSPIYNFENALRHANGDYIFLCDQDDVWLPNKVEVVRANLEIYDLVVHDCKVTDANLNIVQSSFFQSLSAGKGFWKNWIKNSYSGSCMAFKRKVLDYVLPFPPHIAMHDIWIGLLVERRGKVNYINMPLILYRRHGGNASFGNEKSHYSIGYRIWYRLVLLYQLLKRLYF